MRVVCTDECLFALDDNGCMFWLWRACACAEQDPLEPKSRAQTKHLEGETYSNLLLFIAMASGIQDKQHARATLPMRFLMVKALFRGSPLQR